MTGAQFNHIPFKGGPEVVSALLGGHVEVTDEAFTLVLPHVRARKFRMLLTSNYKTPEELKKLSMEGYETANAIALKIGLRK